MCIRSDPKPNHFLFYSSHSICLHQWNNVVLDATYLRRLSFSALYFFLCIALHQVFYWVNTSEILSLRCRLRHHIFFSALICLPNVLVFSRLDFRNSLPLTYQMLTWWSSQVSEIPWPEPSLQHMNMTAPTQFLIALAAYRKRETFRTELRLGQDYISVKLTIFSLRWLQRVICTLPDLNLTIELFHGQRRQLSAGAPLLLLAPDSGTVFHVRSAKSVLTFRSGLKAPLPEFIFS